MFQDERIETPNITERLTDYVSGNKEALEDMLPLVYGELRRLASQKMARENPGQTLDATALVHEAFLRLVGEDDQPAWENREHFFGAAAEAMRRILVENARRKTRIKHGGGKAKVSLNEQDALLVEDPLQVLAINEALDGLADEDEMAAKVAKFRYFAGFSIAFV